MSGSWDMYPDDAVRYLLEHGEPPVEEKKRFGWCADDCPRQETANPDDCNCGGFEKEAEMSVAYMRSGACHHPTHWGETKS